MSSFDEWSERQPTELLLDHERPADPASTAPAAEEPVDVPVAAAELDPVLRSIQTDPEGAAEVLRHYAREEYDMVLHNALTAWENGDDPAELARTLERHYSPEVKAAFVARWLADEEGEPEPLTAKQFLHLEQMQAQLAQETRWAEQIAAAEQEQEHRQAEINKTISETFARLERQHGARARGNMIRPGQDVREVFNRLGANIDVHSPEEAAAATEKLYRQAVVLLRDSRDATLRAEIPEDMFRDRYMTADSDRPLETFADRYAREFAAAPTVNPAVTDPRPTFAEEVARDLSAGSSPSDLTWSVEQHWNI